MIFIGFIIGFLGYLPPGNINLTVVQISISRSKGYSLWYYVLFAAVMEFVYCFGSLVGLKFLEEQSGWILVMKWSSVVVFMVLGMMSFLARVKDPEKRSTGIRRGIIIAILNPLQIPFWLIWGVYVMQNHWVQPDYLSIIFFSLITASGAFTVLWLYSIAGRKMEAMLNANQKLLNIIIGCIFISLAVLELIKLVHPKSIR
jgi:threonine/homoserine/homoserine lactone efflux protein